MSRVTRFPDMEAAREAAALWIARLDRGLSAAEQAEFGAWLRSTAHRRAFDDLGGVWNDLDVLGVLADVCPRAAPRPPRRRALLAAGGVGACVVLAALLLPFAPWRDAPPESGVAATPPIQREAFATAIGEQRSITLRDGSLLSLNTDSLVEASFVDGQRLLYLRRGEAHFEVAHDAARPFIVSAGDHAIRAVGTAFNIRLRGEHGADVLVTSGTVRVTDTLAGSAGGPASTVSAGEMLRLQEDGSRRQSRPDAAEVESRLAWRRSVLIFDGQTLDEVLAEVSRYTPLTLRLADPALGQRRVVGYFPSRDLQVLLRALDTSFGIEAETSGATIVLRARGGDAAPD